ncbi:MAG TPA: hypothetical protein VLJ10_00025, partial [Candidatus Bathyarchaeia archaeon]|nr:hypothetical protein [Candidatus Bathyarchaeia archaeon]
MKRLLFKTLLCLIITGVPVCLASAQTEFDRETFRISPPAIYKYINLKQRDLATIGTSCADDGLLYYDTKNMVVMCQKNSTSPYSLLWAPLPGVWRQEGNNILATDIRTTDQAMRVGIGTNAPVLGLTIAGDG